MWACGKAKLTRPSQLLVAETGVAPSKMAERETGESATYLKIRRMTFSLMGGIGFIYDEQIPPFQRSQRACRCVFSFVCMSSNPKFLL